MPNADLFIIIRSLEFHIVQRICYSDNTWSFMITSNFWPNERHMNHM